MSAMEDAIDESYCQIKKAELKELYNQRRPLIYKGQYRVARNVATLPKTSVYNAGGLPALHSRTFLHTSAVESLNKLKDSTKKLLCLLEDIQGKTITKVTVPDDLPKLSEQLAPSLKDTSLATTASEVIGYGALKRLENQTKLLDTIYVENEDDDCSVFKRLTRKCVCLNQEEYNDFIIHFNEDTKYYSTVSGEIVKNLRILKKFLYMGGNYCKNALMFLNEGLNESIHAEKIALIQGCAYADICNVFDDHSIVVTCISWPCKYSNCGDAETQALAANCLHKLAQIEEGRRYLNFTSKLTVDIKKVLKKKIASIEYSTLETLNETLNLMHPIMSQNFNITYHCKPVEEGFVSKTVKALLQCKKYMTFDEVYTYLEVLLNLSQRENSKMELTLQLPTLFVLFKQMVIDYDHTDMNTVITNIMNNIIFNSVSKKNEVLPKTMIVADVGTEAIQVKTVCNQVPPPKHNKSNKSKGRLGSTNKFRQASKRKVSDWDSSRILNKSKKFSSTEQNVIVVPVEEK